MDTSWELATNPLVLIAAFSAFIAAVVFELYLRHKKHAEKKERKPHTNRIEKILDHMKEHEKDNITVSMWMKAAGVKKETAQHDLKKLVELGVLKKEGKGRGAHYCFVKKSKRCKNCEE